MPEGQDVEDDLISHSSSEIEPDVASAPAEEAQSSSAADVEKDTLSIVRDVVRAEGEPDQASSAEGESEVEGAEPELPKEPDNENYSDVPFGKHPRFKEVLAKVKAFEGDAKRYQQVESYLATNGLTAEDAASALDMMARIKRGDPDVWKVLRPIAEQAATRAGALLTPEMQQRVARGELTREAAVELSRATAQVQAATAQRQREAEQFQNSQRQQVAAARSTAVDQWKAERAIRDPNFAAKTEAIQKELFFLTGTQGEPQTPAEIVAMLNKAYANVSAAAPAKAPQPPQKPAVRPVTGGQVAGTPRSTPQSTLDIIRARVGQS
jgi:hypothetical protein